MRLNFTWYPSIYNKERIDIGVKWKKVKCLCFAAVALKGNKADNCERERAVDREKAREKESSGCRKNCDEYEGMVFSVTVRICVDPGGFRETKRVITRPRASVVPSRSLTPRLRLLYNPPHRARSNPSLSSLPFRSFTSYSHIPPYFISL